MAPTYPHHLPLSAAALPSLIPAIALDAGLDEAATAMLLSSFFPGDLVTQLPGGWLATRIGAKRVSTPACLALCLAAPAPFLKTPPETSKAQGKLSRQAAAKRRLQRA